MSKSVKKKMTDRSDRTGQSKTGQDRAGQDRQTDRDRNSLKICLSPRGNTKPPLFVMVVRRFGPLALLQLLK